MAIPAPEGIAWPANVRTYYPNPSVNLYNLVRLISDNNLLDTEEDIPDDAAAERYARLVDEIQRLNATDTPTYEQKADEAKQILGVLQECVEKYRAAKGSVEEMAIKLEEAKADARRESVIAHNALLNVMRRVAEEENKSAVIEFLASFESKS